MFAVLAVFFGAAALLFGHRLAVQAGSMAETKQARTLYATDFDQMSQTEKRDALELSLQVIGSHVATVTGGLLLLIAGFLFGGAQ